MRGRAPRAVLLALVVVASLALGGSRLVADGPDRDEVGSACPADGADGRQPLEGFSEVPFQVVAADGATTEGCALLAATPAARSQGLMGQAGLRGYDGMAFRFPEATTGAFYMYRTVVPLSIAFFDAAGRFVSSADMAPCPEEEAAACPTYGATGPYTHALEVLEGDLDALGIGPGASISFG